MILEREEKDTLIQEIYHLANCNVKIISWRLRHAFELLHCYCLIVLEHTCKKQLPENNWWSYIRNQVYEHNATNTIIWYRYWLTNQLIFSFLKKENFIETIVGILTKKTLEMYYKLYFGLWEKHTFGTFRSNNSFIFGTRESEYTIRSVRSSWILKSKFCQFN